MNFIAEVVLAGMQHLGRGESVQGITHHKLRDNPYWPAELRRVGAPAHERFVLLLPLALSRSHRALNTIVAPGGILLLEFSGTTPSSIRSCRR
jgi:hypothetical protein